MILKGIDTVSIVSTLFRLTNTYVRSLRGITNAGIAFFLSNWIREGMRPPHIVVTDKLRSLLMAYCMSELSRNIQLQKKICTRSLLYYRGKIKYAAARRMLHNDFARTMRSIGGWPEIKDALKRAKNFYLHSAASIISSISYKEVKRLLEYFFIILPNGTEGDDENGSRTLCEVSKRVLKEQIVNLPESTVCDVPEVTAFHEEMPEFEVDLGNSDKDVIGTFLGISSIYIRILKKRSTTTVIETVCSTARDWPKNFSNSVKIPFSGPAL